VECLALAGDVDGAVEAFENLLAYGNDVGLFSEEIDPTTGGLLGNFPQAFTHVGLINAALTLGQSLGHQGAEYASRPGALITEEQA
jgi:GH15 family glucan-1,4-alpha-glucosidase